MFASVADGTIRRYDASDQQGRISWKSTTRITVESRGRNIATRVWALCILQDGTLISADSLGQVQFWDSETGSLKQTIEQSDSKADVLDLAVSSDETKIFASGVDSRVVCMERQSDNQRWVLTHAQRPHTHDVKSLEICRKKTKQKTPEGEPVIADILVTGGVDTKICTYDMAMFHRRRPRTIYPWPTTTPVFMAAKARMLGLMREDKVDIYRLHEKQKNKISSPVLVPEEETLVGTVEIRHPSNLSCASISSDGNYLAVANMVSFYLFALSFGDEGLEAKRISADFELKESVSAMRFLSDSVVALSCTNGSMHILSLEKTGTDHEIHSLGTVDSDTTTDFSFGTISTPPSGAFVALQRNGWNDGGVEIISVEKGGSARAHWTLPAFDSPVTNVTFLDDDRLAVACLNFSLYIFDVKERRLNQWNRNESNGSPNSLPSELRDRKDYPVRLLPHGGNPNRVLVVSLT
jgi:U3 small nucleolar RNA-associated protein 4